MFLPIFSGFSAGVVHTLSGPDHLAAVAPLALGPEGGSAPSRLGALWGLGHGLGILIFGLILRAFLPEDGIKAFSTVAELVVGLSLIALGAWAINRSRRVRQLPPGQSSIDEPGISAGQEAAAGAGGTSRTALGIGALHGLAGGQHALALVPALGMQTGEGVLYLLGYVLAAIAAMAGVTLLVARFGKRFSDFNPSTPLRWTGCAAIGVGVVWILRFLA